MAVNSRRNEGPSAIKASRKLLGRVRRLQLITRDEAEGQALQEIAWNTRPNAAGNRSKREGKGEGINEKEKGEKKG
jgi:hypothetical protein